MANDENMKWRKYQPKYIMAYESANVINEENVKISNDNGLKKKISEENKAKTCYIVKSNEET